MDSFFAQNKDFLAKQVAAFEAQPAQASVTSKGNKNSSSDTLVGARIRPLLQREVESGQIVVVSTKAGEGSAAVHELRAKINGKPAVNASVSVLID